jgi:alpha-1,3-glucan synthase
LSTVAADEKEMLQMQLHFSTEMDCQQVSAAISFSSTTGDGSVPEIQNDTIKCLQALPSNVSDLNAVVPTTWEISFNITNVANGIHTLSVNNASSADATMFTNSMDNFLFRIGQSDNPMVFPYSANYSSSLYFKDGVNRTYINHKAVGVDKFRYSTNWGSSWSSWLQYDATNTNTTIIPQAWTGTSAQSWSGDHIKVQYWSQKAGSSDHVQEGDVLGTKASQRRWPRLFLHGPFNQYGYDAGFFNIFRQDSAGFWNFNFMTEWPAQWQANVWGVNPDGFPDATAAYGDVDGDKVLDRILPINLEENLANITTAPATDAPCLVDSHQRCLSPILVCAHWICK